MKNTTLGSICGVTLAFGLSSAAWSADLQVSPVSLEIPASGATGVLTLHNASDRPLNAQARVYRWTQVDGKDELEETDAVVASPPVAEIGPGQNYSLRIVRADGAPAAEPEYYRLIVDELPEASSPRNGTVNLVLRYSVPVFFSAGGGDPKLSWSVEKANGRVAVTLRNDGDRHVRISGLKLKDKSGGSVSFGSGLVGYALGHSSVQWLSPPARGFTGGPAEISAMSDIGAVHATAGSR